MNKEIIHKLNIAVSHNSQTGGSASNSLRQIVKACGDNLIDVDYRKIAPNNTKLELIYSDEKIKNDVFTYAKQQAVLLLEHADCLILPGNSAIVDPRLYNENLPDNEKNQIDLSRAIAEMALAHVAIQKGMPILAICGGHQILNVYLDGKLQNLDENDCNDYLQYSMNTFLKKSELASILFPNTRKTTDAFFGAHRQVVDPNNIGGKGMIMGDDLLAIVANANNDSSNIEAMEAKAGATIFSLQFHPEVAVAGMYSVVNNAVCYQAKTKHIYDLNIRIFKQFHTAVESYSRKKKVNTELRSTIQKQPAEKCDIKTSKTDDKSLAVYKEIRFSARSIFTEKTVMNDTNKDHINYRHNKFKA